MKIFRMAMLALVALALSGCASAKKRNSSNFPDVHNAPDTRLQQVKRAFNSPNY